MTLRNVTIANATITAAQLLLLGLLLLLSPPGLPLHRSSAYAFAPSSTTTTTTARTSLSARLQRDVVVVVDDDDGATDRAVRAGGASEGGRRGTSSRRDVIAGTLATATAWGLSSPFALVVPLPASAGDVAGTVVVAGATGQTGRRILERLASSSSMAVVAGVRDVDRARKSLAESGTVVRGAMVQRVDSISSASSAGGGLEMRRLDVATDTVEQLTNALAGATYLIIAVGFVPGNPLKMNAAAHEVDNVGTCKLIDAAKAAGIKKVVMISSILSNGRAWGQEKSPGFVVTNAFGNVLDEKIVAENHLRASGLDYTIVRPGGLKAKPPTGALRVSGEDTLNAGEISRDLVADVCVACLTDKGASNKVLEIIEDAESEPRAFNGLNM